MLVNGSFSHLFKAFRALSQGDLLSRFLFRMLAEALRAILWKAKDLGFIGGFDMGRNREAITCILHMTPSCST